MLRDRVREHHRKLWFEEQARKQAGEKGFDVPKERRPSFRGAVSAFANGLGNPEDRYVQDGVRAAHGPLPFATRRPRWPQST